MFGDSSETFLAAECKYSFRDVDSDFIVGQYHAPFGCVIPTVSELHTFDETDESCTRGSAEMR